jgi:hypothetical protein
MKMPDWYREPTSEELLKGRPLLMTDAKQIRFAGPMEVTPIETQQMLGMKETPDWAEQLSIIRSELKELAEILGVSWQARVINPSEWDALIEEILTERRNAQSAN